jgi:hypothetical protein
MSLAFDKQEKWGDNPSCAELLRALDKSVESYYEVSLCLMLEVTTNNNASQFHIFAPNGVSLLDRTVMTERAIELIETAGGEIREDWREQTGLIL